jgi:hypothetical protein
MIEHPVSAFQMEASRPYPRSLLVLMAEAKYAEMHERYFNEYDLPGWMLLKSQLDFALWDPEILGGVLPEEAEKPQ